MAEEVQPEEVVHLISVYKIICRAMRRISDLDPDFAILEVLRGRLVKIGQDALGRTAGDPHPAIGAPEPEEDFEESELAAFGLTLPDTAGEGDPAGHLPG